MLRFFSFWIVILFSCNLVYSGPFNIDTLYNTDDNWISGQYSDLPAWIFYGECDDCVISVSDPCMKPEKGREQAVLRALFLYSLRNKAELKYLSESFSVSDELRYGVVEKKNKILSLINLVPSDCKYYYKIEKEYVSAFNEVFLKVRVVPFENFCKVGDDYLLFDYNSKNEFMLSFLDDNYEGKDLYINSSISSNNTSLNYVFKGDAKNPKLNSRMNGTDLFRSGKGFWYTQTLDSIDYKYCGTDMIDSFWNAYIISFAEFLFSYPYKDSGIKYAGEIYDNSRGEHESGTKEMSRSIVNTKVGIRSHLKGILNNKLYVEWQLVQENR